MSQKPQIDTTSLEYHRFLMSYARERMAAKNYYDADFALQVSQSRNSQDSVAYNLQAMLAYRLGLYEHGILFAKKALRLNPRMERAQENLISLERAYIKEQALPKGKQEKYCLIHSWGSGLGFELLYLMQQLLIAELGQRQPVVYWGANCLYNAKPTQDCFIEYFEPISSLTIEDVTQYMPDVYPEHWQQRDLKDYIRLTRWRNKSNNQQYKIGGPYFFNRPEKLVVAGEFASVLMLRPWLINSHRYSDSSVADIYRDLVRRYIRPKQNLQDKANKFIQQSFDGNAYLAIHLRGTDKHNEKQSNGLASINADLIDKLHAVPGGLPVFLMTDDTRQLQKMKTIFGDRLNSVDVSRSSDEDLGLHHSSKRKRKMTEEVLVDMLIASRSSHFYGCGYSYLACMVAYMQASENSNTIMPFDVMTRFIDIPMPEA